MRTDTLVKQEGINALIAQLGYVDTGRFIALINSESFDYTKWREQFLDVESSVRENSQKACEGHIISEERKQINYVVVCVSEFARRHNMKLKEAFQFLFQYKAIEFLKENYDIEHTLSLNDALDDMLIVCRNNGGIIQKEL